MKTANTHPHRVLIADDQADIRDALRLLLKREGYETQGASSPAEALAAVEAREFDAVLMDLDTYEQIPVPFEELGEQGDFLKEDSEVVALVSNAETLGYELPNFVELEVVETDPGYKGDTVSSGSTKPAKLESGATIQVPFHINIGDLVKVDSRSRAYLERVKK